MMEDKNPIQVAGRLFGMMEVLAEKGPLSLAELAAGLSLNKSTAHRVASSLQYMGYVRQDPETSRYELTFRIVGLAEQVRSNTDILGKIRPHLTHLAERSGETVHLVRREGGDMVYIDKVESSVNSMRMSSRIGSTIPIYRSGVGKAIAARLPLSEVEEIWNTSRIEPVTPHTITDYSEFLRVLEDVRLRGYALDNEENETGVRCVAAALSLGETTPEYAFSISVPISRLDSLRFTELAALVLETKAEIERQFLGVQG
jgi:DNA-binding IclR family transcriptional regulator